MAGKVTTMLKVVIDGFKMDHLYDVTIEHGTFTDNYGFERDTLFREKPADVRVKLTANDNTVLTFRIQGYEQVGDTLYFYGPLRALFPEIFKDHDLLEWQVEYLASMKRPSLDRFKMRRSDDYFTGDRATAFKLGYEAGHKAGGVNERKLARIAAEGLKNPPTAAKAVKDFATGATESAKAASVLGEALRRKQERYGTR